jgi:rRNA maturation endonuclease Nob1
MMAKKLKIFCYGCEQEFSIQSRSKDAPLFCPYCAAELETADKDEEDDGRPSDD